MRRPILLTAFAEKEAAWFFGELGGKVPREGDPVALAAAVQIDTWLRAIPAFHRGVLLLRYAQRSWPHALVEEFRGLTSIVVRLECTLHPALGVSTAAHESAAAVRLQEELEGRAHARKAPVPTGRLRRKTPGERTLRRLARRAEEHVDLAIEALAKARGLAICVAPDQGAP